MELQRQLGLISHSDELKEKVINYIKSLVRNPSSDSSLLEEPVPNIVKSLIGAGEKVYSGMVIGQSSKAEDIELNVCKKKHLTNTRSSSADEALTLVPPRILSLEQALDFIDTDELLEVTPTSLRIRKRILDPTLRRRASYAKKNAMNGN